MGVSVLSQLKAWGRGTCVKGDGLRGKLVLSPTIPRFLLGVVSMGLTLLIATSAYSQAGVQAMAGDIDDKFFILDDNGDVFDVSSGYVFESDNASSVATPYKIKGLNQIVSLAPYGVVRKDGKVLTWDLLRKRGRGDSYTIPKIVNGISRALKIAALDHYYLVLLEDGRVVEWGRPLYYKSKSIPLHIIPGLHDVLEISVSYSAALVLTKSGEVFGWDSGHPTPFLIYSGGNVKSISQGEGYRLVLTKDGHVLYWSVEYPIGPVPTSLPPCTKLMGYVDEIDNVAGIYADHGRYAAPSLYIRMDGSVWSVYAPDPSVQHCFHAYFDPEKSWVRSRKVLGMTVAALTAGIGEGGGMVIGIDHTLWMENSVDMNHPKLEKVGEK